MIFENLKYRYAVLEKSKYFIIVVKSIWHLNRFKSSNAFKLKLITYYEHCPFC